jgi:hypothetical protein
MRGRLILLVVLVVALADGVRAGSPIGDGGAEVSGGVGGAGLLATARAPESVKAFPTAEGFGAKSTGGRGGRVIEVTNLEDAGDGSLRSAMEASGPRNVVFRVSGTITLKTAIRVSTPYLTVAGQTSPGGVQIRGDGRPEGDWDVWFVELAGDPLP